MIKGSQLRDAFISGANSISNCRQQVDALNVFPVPDGDTGTNMSMTINAAKRELETLKDDPTVEQVSKKAASALLRGARGNSGVILSLLFRGFSKGLEGKEEADATDIAHALSLGVSAAYKAVMKPTEGTILTVARLASEHAQQVAQQEEVTEVMMWKEILSAAEDALAQTPEMLPVLKKAGVVDAGGQGFVEIWKGMLSVIENEQIIPSEEEAQAAPKEKKAHGVTAEFNEEDIHFCYCTEFIINVEKPYDMDEEHRFKGYLSSIGDCVVVVSDDDVIKVHVHTNDPGLAIQKALTYGSLSRIKIDNMREEHQEKLIKEAEKIAKAQKAEEEAQKAKAEEPRKPYGFIAVSIGEGFGEIFKGIGVDYLIEGGQTMNPSTEDMLTAIDHVNADTIYILPNNSNIILAAEQATHLAEGKNIIVVPSKTVPQGITAIINFVPDMTPEENKANMIEEMSRVKTGQITYAVRNTVIDDKEISEGDIMGIADKGIVAVGKEVEDTALETIKTMLDDESELVTVYYGADVTEKQAEGFLEKVQEICGDCDVELQFGGQPIYYYLISVE